MVSLFGPGFESRQLHKVMKKKDQFTVKDSVENSEIINITLRDYEAEAKGILNNFAQLRIFPTFSKFNHKFGRKISKDSFYNYAEDYILNNSEFRNWGIM